MISPVVYSTNVFIKYIIYEKYRNGIHYIWCSENYDSKKCSPYSHDALVPTSSNPADIYRQLLRDIESKDKHSLKISEQKASLTQLAIEWAEKGDIDTDKRDEITYMIEVADFEYWRLLIYVIPRASVEARMKLVPIQNRAGFGDEYIIEDLRRHEFDMIE